MPKITTDRDDPDLCWEINKEPGPQNKAYLVLSKEERSKGFIRPIRSAYKHNLCGKITTMGKTLSETYARQPDFYRWTYCYPCNKHFYIDEFVWDGTDEIVGS